MAESIIASSFPDVWEAACARPAALWVEVSCTVVLLLGFGEGNEISPSNFGLCDILALFCLQQVR